jgi:hypothetical protein
MFDQCDHRVSKSMSMDNSFLKYICLEASYILFFSVSSSSYISPINQGDSDGYVDSNVTLAVRRCFSLSRRKC